MNTKSTFDIKLVLLLLLLPNFVSILTINAQTTHTIEVSSNVFSPSDLNIMPGDTVTWTNVEGFHNVNGTTSAYPANPESFGNSTGSGWTYTHVFTLPGVYNYHCDPHVGLGMTGKITVQGGSLDMLTVNFLGMGPHLDQDLWLSVKNQETGEEIKRIKTTVQTEFSVEINGLVTGQAYYIDFYADHNQNGRYDIPPADHAWRLEIDNFQGNESVNFMHNTNFTDIEWMHKLTVDFSSMNPHVGQDLWLIALETETGTMIKRTNLTISEEFEVHIFGIKPGNSYMLDFYADFNENGKYDAPPADHAWRLKVNEINGDTTVMFVHNTEFTDISWQHKLTVSFQSMNPHVGQQFTVYIADAATNAFVDTLTLEQIPQAEFSLHSFSLQSGNSYHIDFYADHNENGMYDAPPTDHAWRMQLNELNGDTLLTFVHNTSFTDIFAVTSANNTSLQGLNIYPNPAKRNGWIQIDGLYSTDQQIEIYNLKGQLVGSWRMDRHQQQIYIRLTNVEPGIYFMQILSDDDHLIKKLIIQ